MSGKFPLGLGIAPLKLKIMLESNPMKSRISVRRLAAPRRARHGGKRCAAAPRRPRPAARARALGQSHGTLRGGVRSAALAGWALGLCSAIALVNQTLRS